MYRQLLVLVSVAVTVAGASGCAALTALFTPRSRVAVTAQARAVESGSVRRQRHLGLDVPLHRRPG